jgi:predicted N-formylglutamate amidohydrolase
MAERSETHEISGNKNLSAAQRLARTKALYLPFHDRLRGVIALRLALGLQPILVTVHSFTPIYHGQKRAMEFGVIHDQDPRLAQALLARAKDHLGLITKLNEPYSAADEVTHTLALQATPYAIANVMLEVRNDLIATKAQQADLSARLAPILQDAVYDLTPSQGSH